MEVEKNDEFQMAGGDGYGPQRRQRQKHNEVVLEPCEIEGMEVEVVEDADEEMDLVYEKPTFGEIKISKKAKKEMRRITVPPNRLTPLKKSWMEIVQPLIEHMKLQVRFNKKRRAVELRTSEATEEEGALQRGSDFCRAFIMGFEVQDAIALLRLSDLYIDSFQVKDVKRLNGDHLTRCIGRIAGQAGKTKYAIENSTRTRIVVAEDKIHILGSFANMKQARDSICALILGSEPGKVYNRLKTVSKRVSERL